MQCTQICRKRFATRALQSLLMLRVSLVTTVWSSRETAGLKLSMRTTASPGDESKTNGTEQGACWRPHLQITWIKVLHRAVEKQKYWEGPFTRRKHPPQCRQVSVLPVASGAPDFDFNWWFQVGMNHLVCLYWHLFLLQSMHLCQLLLLRYWILNLV